jgi:hypothetical protein
MQSIPIGNISNQNTNTSRVLTSSISACTLCKITCQGSGIERQMCIIGCEHSIECIQ